MNQLFGDSQIQLNQLMVRVTHKRDVVCDAVNAWHSFRAAPQGWRVAFELTDGVTIYGVATFGRPVARMEDRFTTLEHTRMALSPNAPRNAASFFLAQCRAWIRENMPEIQRLISYVPSDEHSGVTYRADNWLTVYAGEVESARWTNRRGRRDVGCRTRTKFERAP